MPWMMFTQSSFPDGATLDRCCFCQGRECWPWIGGAGLRLISGAPGGSLPSEPDLHAVPSIEGVKIVAPSTTLQGIVSGRLLFGVLRRIQGRRCRQLPARRIAG
jgi:hypothetical protein